MHVILKNSPCQSWKFFLFQLPDMLNEKFNIRSFFDIVNYLFISK